MGQERADGIFMLIGQQDVWQCPSPIKKVSVTVSHDTACIMSCPSILCPTEKHRGKQQEHTHMLFHSDFFFQEHIALLLFVTFFVYLPSSEVKMTAALCLCQTSVLDSCLHNQTQLPGSRLPP